jgi:hypothetical protein
MGVEERGTQHLNSFGFTDIFTPITRDGSEMMEGEAPAGESKTVHSRAQAGSSDGRKAHF